MAGCTNTSQPKTLRLHATNTTEQFEAFTGFLAAVGLDAARFTLKRKSVSTAGTAPTLTFKIAYRIAQNRADNPGAWNVIAGFSTTGAGEDLIDVNCASITAGQAFIQWGVSYTLGGTAPTDGQADVELTITTQTCGASAGTRSEDLTSFNTTTNTFVAISGWLPTLGVQAVVTFFTICGIAGNLRLQLCYRTATTSTQSAGAWTLLEGTNYRSTDGETTTGEIALSLSTVMWVQFGIAYSQSSAGSAPGKASVTTSCWTRRT